MISIGEFALSTGLSVNALRFYDERGLLVPAEVDPHTGYRRDGRRRARRPSVPDGRVPAVRASRGRTCARQWIRRCRTPQDTVTKERTPC